MEISVRKEQFIRLNESVESTRSTYVFYSFSQNQRRALKCISIAVCQPTGEQTVLLISRIRSPKDPPACYFQGQSALLGHHMTQGLAQLTWCWPPCRRPCQLTLASREEVTRPGSENSSATKSQLGLFQAVTHPPSKFYGTLFSSFCLSMSTNQHTN